MYAYRKKRIIRNVLLVTSLLVVGIFLMPVVLANIPSTQGIINSIENKITNTPQVNADTSSDKPCIMDTSHPSLTGGTPTNPPCIIQNGSTTLYCSEDNSGISCTVNKPQPSTQIDDNTSPYGPKQTQYYMDQLRQQPRFMDCSDQQLIHYFNLESQSYQLSYVHSPPVLFFSNSDEEMKFAQSHPDAYRYMTDMQNGATSSEENNWVSEKQNEYNSLSSQILNYGC